MASSLRVSQILPSVGTNVAIGTDTGSVTISGTVTGVSTFSSISATTVNATRLVGVSTAGITTVYVGSINDGPISGARNRIINGDMRLDQRNSGSSVSINQTSAYVVDRWKGEETSNGQISVQRSGIVPVGFTSSLLVTVTTAATDMSTTSNRALVYQHIEGYNIADLNWGTANAQTVTLSFWVRSSLNGTFGGSIRNADATRSYPFTYTTNSANTWEYKTITIPGDTTGTWLNDSGIGMTINFGLGIASNLSGTPGSWAAANLLSATGAVKLIETLNATWYITGVQLEAGTVATPFERRSYGQELALCQRYYLTRTHYFNIPGSLATASNGQRYLWESVQFPVPMRSVPTMPADASGTLTGANNYASQTLTFQWGYTSSIYEAVLKVDNPSGGTFSFSMTANAEL